MWNRADYTMEFAEGDEEHVDPCIYRAFVRKTRRNLQDMVNKAWPLIAKVRLEKGEQEAQELDEALKFLETIIDECGLLTW